MSVIVDVLIGIGSGGLVQAGMYAKQFLEKKKIQPDELGALPWLWETGHNYGFQCVKCIARNKKQPKICSCMDYPRIHFHFKCEDCGFESIMRTADDK